MGSPNLLDDSRFESGEWLVLRDASSRLVDQSVSPKFEEEVETNFSRMGYHSEYLLLAVESDPELPRKATTSTLETSHVTPIRDKSTARNYFHSLSYLRRLST